MTLEALIQLRRHWRAIDMLLLSEIEAMKAEAEKPSVVYKKAAPPTVPLTEGEPYCQRCLHHVKSCQCLVRTIYANPK